ncbi:hypothetical protein UFOVP787_17 [uncultured Caudovirales phage]|uniref:Uncharacterized protein n=1 Tax=uncultured Caudovirales phage TaxID=2100421 RepID=A0A6J5NYW8_9CAUD|nr:hypothetical protein UFOVP787_17 [uncultured Caudovirales phage]
MSSVRDLGRYESLTNREVIERSHKEREERITKLLNRMRENHLKRLEQIQRNNNAKV